VIGTIKLLWRDNKLLFSGFVLALAVMVFFAVRSIAFWVYWADPAHRNQDIQAWMTPRYVAHSWHVPPEFVGEALGLKPGSGRTTIGEVAATLPDVSIEELIARLTADIIAFRADRKAKRDE
jgi:hypothetical protein